VRHLIELSGESEALATAEALGACLSAGEARLVESDGRALVAESPLSSRELAGRLGLAWSVSEHLLSCPRSEMEPRLRDVRLPSGSLRVRACRLDAAHPAGSGTETARLLGKMLSGTHPVDLETPDMELRVLMAGRLHVGILAGVIDRHSFEARKAENRPFNHPISLHPRLARALVNLTRAKAGERLLDPFCGTGGILIEAGQIGCKAVGGDIDPRMVEGSGRNLAAFNVKGYELRKADISEWASSPGTIDAVATDPPYGRSASTASEPVERLYRRAFESCHAALRPCGRLAMVLPGAEHADLASGFSREGVWPVRVHKSLTRYFCLFKKD
jgi:tRNA (guanine10-N2)-dimethyltransferase